MKLGDRAVSLGDAQFALTVRTCTLKFKRQNVPEYSLNSIALRVTLKNKDV